jgi:hypothetical protein
VNKVTLLPFEVAHGLHSRPLPRQPQKRDEGDGGRGCWGGTEEEIELLAVDAGYAIHEITARAEGDGLIRFGEEGTCPPDVDCQDISLLKFLEGGFGTKGCREPKVQVQISKELCGGGGEHTRWWQMSHPAF